MLSFHIQKKYVVQNVKIQNTISNLNTVTVKYAVIGSNMKSTAPKSSSKFCVACLYSSEEAKKGAKVFRRCNKNICKSCEDEKMGIKKEAISGNFSCNSVNAKMLSMVEYYDRMLAITANINNLPLECYNYISAGNHLFLDKLEIVSKLVSAKAKFVDVGCGTGLKLLLAKTFFDFHVTGIEINPSLVKISKQYAPRYNYIKNGISENVVIHEIDAREFNNYHEFDIIYFYCPIKLVNLQRQLETRIFSEMKVGAFVIGIRSQTANVPKGIERISEYIFKKISDHTP